MKHIWIGDNRYLVTDNFDETEGSEDLVALGKLDELIKARAAATITPEQEQRASAAKARMHERGHAMRCCAEHGTHSMPHRGCILR